MRVFAITHRNNATDGFDTIEIECTSAKIWSELHCCQITNTDRNAITLLNNGGFKILNGAGRLPAFAKNAFATKNEFHPVGFKRFGTNIQIGILHRHHDFVEWDSEVAQFVRIDFDLVLPNVPSDRRYLADTLDCLKLVFDDEVLHASQVCQ